MAEAPSDPASGRYETLLELGRGGMGRAVLARAVGVGGFERLVVVKRMHQHLLSEPEATRRFIDEARLAAYVHHANVVGIHQIGNDSEGLFLVLDYVEGGSLDEVVDRAVLRGEPLPVPIVLRVALDALAGLRALHDARNAQGQHLQILHRDVSPQNVLVGRDGLARITDLGIAKSAIMAFSTDKAFLVGKLLYLAPEYLRRDRVGPTLDIYAMGLTLWTVLAGEEPWPGADEAQLVAHVLQDGVPPVSSVASVPPQLDAIIAKACSYDPSKRYQSAKEMADAIEAMGRETGWIASPSDVASFVESLLGVDLERRREHIVAALARRQSSAAQADTLLAKAPAALTGPLAFTMTNEGPSARRRWIAPALVLGAGALVGAGLLVRARQVEQPVESPAPSVLALSSEPSPLPPPPAPEVPTPSATAAAATAEPPQALPARRRQAPAEKRSADPAPQPVAPLPELAPPKPPEPAAERPPKLDGITRKNPYR